MAGLPSPRPGGLDLPGYGLRLPGYGYLNDVPVTAAPVRIPELSAPTQKSPDIVRATLGAGDPAMVGALLRVAAGESNELSGVSSEYAARILSRAGFPTRMDDWSADQWQSAIAGQRAARPFGG